VINKVDYFNQLGVNAIELMPVMEFEGDEGWGYNPAFHMALDKFYGPEAKLKELVDTYHQHGIAVILDIALNHAFGRCPLVRMWMKDPDGDGYGDASSENPYFNEFAKHTYGVGNDFNHSADITKNYVRRVAKHWIQDFHIDGFRWDLTKGFTQACSSTDESCTNAYQQDRVDILKNYVDYCWSLDPTHYAIFEHLGIDSEEQQWANYRIGETPSKGVMMWGEMTYPYTQLIEGYATGADISRMGKDAHGFTANRVIGYPESHDKERLVYSAMTYGNGAGTSPLNNLNNALSRMPAIEAVSLLVPGPKMLWHFQELGWNLSAYTCNNGTVNDESSTLAGDCKLDTKPQPQWANNWLGDPNRAQIFNTIAKLASLKINEPVFEGSYAISPDANNVKQRIYIYDNNLPSTQLKNVVVIANFSVATLAINPSFPYTGTWYNLMDNTPVNVTNATATISLGPGQFRVYGNQLPTLANAQFDALASVSLYPNPATSQFAVNIAASKVEVFNVAGQLVKSFGAQGEGFQYPVGDLQNGLYLVRVTNESNQQKTLKFVKE
jgi:glycosidase